MNQYNIWNNNNPSQHPNSSHLYNGWYPQDSASIQNQQIQGQQGQPQHHQQAQHQAQQQGQQGQQQQQQQQGQQAPGQGSPQAQISPDLLINKLNNLSSSSNYNHFLQSLDSQNINQNQNNYHYSQVPNNAYKLTDQLPLYNNNSNTFSLPLELQGGVSNINSRRPSFAAEQSYTSTTSSQQQQNLNLLAHSNNFNNFYNNTSGQNNQLLQNFRSRRPSIQFSNNNNTPPITHSNIANNNSNNNGSSNNGGSQGPNGNLELDNGLILNGNVIITSPALKQHFASSRNYFSVESAEKLYNELIKQIDTNEYLKKIIINLKKLNNLFNLIKPLVLVLTKAGKFEILSTPINSNIFLTKSDVVIVDGDRGKDLVFILDPSISLDVAILINYLKKRQHSKSMSYGGTVPPQSSNPIISNTVEDLCKGQGILDEETQFQIPSKQVLRFATSQEIKNLQFKLVEELKSYKTSLLKISNLSNLNNNLTILNSEYQFDQKKLTFFYFANQRLDFRNLIKELFKIYKTRIWLCAVPKPPSYDNAASTHGLNNDLNSIEFENFKIDDFHVQNFNVTLHELMA